jgi:hypothetical protein
MIIHFDQKKFSLFIIVFASQLDFLEAAIVILSDCKKLLTFISNLTTNIEKLQMSSYHQFVTESFQSRYCRIILSLFVLLLLFYIFLKTLFYCYRI